MKRFQLAVFIVLVLCLVSCNQDSINQSKTEEPNEGENTTTGENVTEMTIPVPVFGEESLASKGFSEMPKNYFGDDFSLSCSVMTIMPTMTNLKSATLYLDGNRVKSGLSLRFEVFGFTLILQEKTCRFNKDGVYLRYSIMNKDSIVGFADYYYNIKENCFSYRQSVICTLDLDLETGQNLQLTTNIALNLEYNDIKIENPLTLEFKAGQLDDKTGFLNNEAFVDRFCFADKYFLDGIRIREPWYNRAYITTKEILEKNGYVVYSFLQPDTVYETEYTSHEEISNSYHEFADFLEKYSDGPDYVIDTHHERTNADINLVFDLLTLTYDRGLSIVQHDQNYEGSVGGYRSYEDFKDDSFSVRRPEFDNVFIMKEIPGMSSYPNPIVYDVTSRDGASVSKGELESGLVFDAIKDWDDDTNDEKYISKDFDKFYGKYDSLSGISVEEFLIRKHLFACGIENESYINRFVDEYLKWERSRNGLNSYKMQRVKADV